jgi:hypothetical protein
VFAVLTGSRRKERFGPGAFDVALARGRRGADRGPGCAWRSPPEAGHEWLPADALSTTGRTGPTSGARARRGETRDWLARPAVARAFARGCTDARCSRSTRAARRARAPFLRGAQWRGRAACFLARASRGRRLLYAAGGSSSSCATRRVLRVGNGIGSPDMPRVRGCSEFSQRSCSRICRATMIWSADSQVRRRVPLMRCEMWGWENPVRFASSRSEH